jgi:hypothetical protein
VVHTYDCRQFHLQDVSNVHNWIHSSDSIA